MCIPRCKHRPSSFTPRLKLKLPPSLSAKLLLAFSGWVIGYDGHFEFESIGDSYIENKVPYIGLRFLPALLGSLIPAVMYGIMRESGYPRVVGVLSAALVLIGACAVSSAFTSVLC